MIRPTGTWAVWSGVGLILIVNLVWLGVVAWDRGDTPRAELTLTERELTMPLDRQETSAGIALTLRLATEAPGLLGRAAWTRRATLPRVELPWFDREKLGQLGFRIDVEPGDPEAAQHYADAAQRRAWVVLEHNGDAWSRWLEERAERVEELRHEVEAETAAESDLADAEVWLAFDRAIRSRLFPVDVGLDGSELQRRYGDRAGFVVLPCLVGPRLIDPDDGPPVIRGRVQDVPARWVSVPRRFKGAFEPFAPQERRSVRQVRERREAREGWPSPTGPRYRVVLAVGRGHALRLVGVETLDPAAGER